MKALIWGDFAKGHEAKRIIEEKKTPIDIYGFVDMDRRKWRDDDIIVASAQKMLVLYKSHVIDKIILPSFYGRNLFRSIIKSASELDIDKEDLIVPPIEYFMTDAEYSLGEFLVPWYKAPQLDYVEFAAADNCNLNCKRCARFAPLIKKKIYDHEEVKEMFLQLKKYVFHINMIRILGGEPFLDEDVDDYFTFLRNLYPFSDIRVVTNGLIIDKLNDRVLESIKANNIGVDISYYPPLKDKLPTVKQILEQREIRYRVDSGEVFFKSFNFKSDDNPRQKKQYCIQWCISLRDGKIYPCATSACFEFFNDCFETGIHNERGLDLFEDNLSIERIKAYLSSPIELCKFCDFTKMYLWSGQDGKPSIADWDIN